MKLFRKSKTMLAALALAALAGGAQADVISVSKHTVGTVEYSESVWAPNAYTGDAALWNVSVPNISATFLAFCIELAQTVNLGGSDDYTTASYAPNANVQELYDRYYGTVLQSKVNAVGFQLALWDLSGQIDVDAFVAPIEAITRANVLLDGVLTSTVAYTAGQYSFTRWSNSAHQDLLQVTPANAVPEPQTHSLMLGGLALLAMGMVVRRRKGR